VLFLGSRKGSGGGLICWIRSSCFFARRKLKLRQCGEQKNHHGTSRFNMKMTSLYAFSRNRKSYVKSLIKIQFKKFLLHLVFPASAQLKHDEKTRFFELLRRLYFPESTLIPRITCSLLNILIRLGVQVLLKT